IREDISFVLAVLLSAIGLAGFDEIVDSAVAAHRCNVGPLAHCNAMGNPIDDQGLGALIPERAVDRILARVHDVEPLGGRRGLNVHADGMRSSLAVRSVECEYVITGLREGSCRQGRSSRGKCYRTRAGRLLPLSLVARRILKPGNLAREVGLTVAHDGAVDPRIDNRRQRRRGSMVEDPPLENACRMTLLRNDLEAQLAGTNRFEGSWIESIGGDSESLRLGNRDEFTSVPVKDSATFRYLNPGATAAGNCFGTRAVDCPIDLNLVETYRLTPLVLHPACVFPVGMIDPERIDRVDTVE